MRFDQIIPIHPASELLLPMGRGIEMRLLMPAFHQRPNHPLGFPIRLRAADFGKSLFDSSLQTSLDECVPRRRAVPFFPIVGIPALNRVGAFLLDLLQEGRGGQLGLIRQDGREQLAREVVNRHVQVLVPLLGRFPLQHGQLACIGMYHLPGIVFVVALRLPFQLVLDLTFDLCQALDAILEAAKALICTVMHRKIALAAALQDLVNRGATHMVGGRQIRDAQTVLVVGLVNLFALFRGQPGLFVNVHCTSVVNRLQESQSVNNARFSNSSAYKFLNLGIRPNVGFESIPWPSSIPVQ